VSVKLLAVRMVYVPLDKLSVSDIAIKCAQSFQIDHHGQVENYNGIYILG